MRPEGLMAASFALLIFVGTVLLVLPMAHVSGRVNLLDALFTATSAVCVTGLIVVDTGQDFTRFGQVVILVLIQFGGLGIMTFAALAAQMFGRRVSFRSQAVLADTFYQREAAGALKKNLKRIVALTLVLELAGAWLLYLDFRHTANGHPPLFSAVFHSISAFCNAGFSLNSESFTLYRGHFLTMFTVIALIVFGGLGHTVVLETIRRIGGRLWRRSRLPVQWSLNTRVVLVSSAALIAVGTVFLLVLGLGEDEPGWSELLPNALFQSVTARTAGFNTIEISALPTASLLVLIGLMFVGGSPGSCAGGIKTTSIAVGYAYLRSKIRSTPDVALFGRRLPRSIVARAVVIGGLAIIWNALGCVILAATELPQCGFPFESVLFEQISAFATVGLSTGITSQLTVIGKLWIVLTMFVGRLGPLAMALAVTPPRTADVRHPEERLMIG
ncbi:MAG: potassium transporter TrkG [Planctomycetota bacterium]